MDLSTTIVPKSDQINAEDLLTGPQTFTIKEVRAGSDEQPVNVILEELPKRAYRPSKSMRRVLVMAWGKDASAYAGRRITLYRDPDVKFGADAVGGIKISHLSHIDRPVTVALTVTRGKRANHRVDVLQETRSERNAGPSPLTQLKAALDNIGVSEKPAMLEFAAKSAGRQITSATDLTGDEIAKVVADAEAIAAPAEGGDEV